MAKSHGSVREWSRQCKINVSERCQVNEFLTFQKIKIDIVLGVTPHTKLSFGFAIISMVLPSNHIHKSLAVQGLHCFTYICIILDLKVTTEIVQNKLNLQ